MSRIARVARFARRRPVVLVAGGVLGVFVLLGVLGPLVAPYDPNTQDLGNRLKPPFTGGHVLGTDLLGRDVLSRLLSGARVSLIVAAAAVGLACLVGVAVGMVAGYVGGAIDAVVMRIVDAWMAFPFLLVAIALVAILGAGLDNLILALVVTGWVVYARLVRGQAAALREREFVLSARGLGGSHRWVMAAHILPNVLSPVMVVATLELGVVIVTEASLSFLGLGVASTQPTWGGMLADGRAYITVAWWLATVPGLAIFLLVLAINLLGDHLRDVLDPRARSRLDELAVDSR